MTNTFKKSLILAVSCLLISSLFAQTTVTWIPSAADVTALTDKTVHVVTVGTGTQQFKVYSIRPFHNNNQVKLEWDASANAIKMTDNGIDKAGLAIFIPNSSDNVQNITVYMHTTGSRKTLYADGASCPSSGTSTATALAKTPTAYNFWSAPFKKDWYYAFGGRKDGSGESYYDKIEVTFAGSTPSTVPVTSVSLNKTTTSLEQGTTETLTATVMPANATDKSVSWSSDNTSVATVDQNGQITAVSTGSANITVTTTDGAKTASCAVTVTAPSTQIDVTGISFNKTTTTLTVGGTESLTITYTPSDANTGKAVTWTSSNTSVATVDQSGKITAVSAGSATITATSTTNNTITASCAVTVQAIPVTGVTLDKTTANLQIGQTETLTATIQPSDATNKNMSWSSDATGVVTVNASGVITAVSAGTATITVTTADGNKTATCAVTVTAGPPVPPTSLTLHEPGKYEEKTTNGGYGGTLSVFNNREYEVYYSTYNTDGNLRVDIFPGQKVEGITYGTTGEYACKANDGWFEMSTTTSKSDFKDRASSPLDEFNSGLWAIHKLLNNAYYKIHIKGYDQFSFYGKDNSTTINPSDASKNKRFQVYIDGVLYTPETPNTTASIRRYNITPEEHVIEVRGIGPSNNEFYGFSLRVAQVPRVKYIKGNDTTQVIMQTTAMRPVTYYTKYNSIGETSLIWDGQEATGIALQTRGSDAIGDTLVLTGTANCPVGIYKYTIQTFLNGNATSSLAGQIEVQSDIKALTETAVDGFQNMSIDDINFSYHALSAEDITLTWENNNAPGGITGSGANGMYSISGTPTTIGTYIYTLTVLGGNSISDTIVIKELNLGNNPILYLYKNAFSYNHDGVYQYLTSPAGGSRNLIPMKAAKAKRAATQYAPYKWILISEDIDANNPEVIDIIRDGANLPVLNLKGFTYAKDDQRLSWGDPNNGAIDSNTVKRAGCMIRIERAQHPIFKKLNGRTDGLEVKILDNYDKNGVMPIEINDMPVVSTCLATGYTRGESYYEIGELQTAIHEIPADQRNGKKYICLPLGRQVTLSQDGKKLLDGIIEYLLSPDQATIEVPETRITKFVIEGKEAIIDEDLKTIRLELTDKQFHELNDLRAVKPQITLADPNYTHVTPASGEELNLQYSMYMSEYFVVSDYVNRAVYDFKVQLINTQGIDELYEAGQWVNIFDIYGRKVSTTNEDIYSMDLPHGMYIVVTENGNTLKIMR